VTSPYVPFSARAPRDSRQKSLLLIFPDNNIPALFAGYCHEVADENGDNSINRDIVPGNMSGSIVFNHQAFYFEFRCDFHVL